MNKNNLNVKQEAFCQAYVKHNDATDSYKKAVCSYYESKSGRGVCSNRGNLYRHGKEVSFEVSLDEH